AEGLVSAPREGLLLEAGQRATADLMLEPAFELRGIVEDMDGKPVPNATVWVRQGSISMAAHTATSGADGRFAVAGLAKGTYRATASASHHVTVSAAGARVPGESLRLALPATATLRGTVRGPSGDTAPNTAVEVVGTDGAGLPVHLTAPPAEPEEEDSSASPLVPAGHLGVTLGGVPPISAAGAPGTARGGNAGFRTDAHGEFEITDVPPGSFRVLALADGYAPSSSASFAVESGDVLEAIDIRLDRGGELEVQVRSGRGTSVPNAQVTVLAAGDPMARVALTDAQGAARFPGILGTADVAVEAPGAAPVRQSAEVASGARATLVVDLAMGAAHVTGRTLDDRGVPIGRVHISIRGRQGAERTTVSDASGDFRIEGLEEGPYTLTATHERHARTTLRVSGETDALEVRLTSGTA
ncbi:MAG: carboxypeptidase regulatory-like domain-containing protein, partial [Myxococcales bacterium]|nr:carboxypeptidase regulatory-like domain-containing protein [Myxococcales bacterium]